VSTSLSVDVLAQHHRAQPVLELGRATRVGRFRDEDDIDVLQQILSVVRVARELERSSQQLRSKRDRSIRGPSGRPKRLL